MVVVALVGLVASLLSGGAGQAATRCPVTKPNGRPLPGLFGNGFLAAPTYYPMVAATPRTLNRDGSVTEKFPWRAYGITGDLKITGRRLDGRAPALRARINPGSVPSEPAVTAFWAVGITFPRLGCWRLTGTVGEHSLTFVTLVAKP